LHPVPLEPDDVGESAVSAMEGSEDPDVITIAVMLAVLSFYSLRTCKATIDQVTVSPDRYREGAEWLRNNVPPGTLIYDVNWSDFPSCFFYDTSHNYVSGLDPLYLFDNILS